MVIQKKGWGPGNSESEQNPAGEKYTNFSQFIGQRPDNMPFCFWEGTGQAHRDYPEPDVDPDEVSVPPYLPDVPIVRSDIASYYTAVQQIDDIIGERIE